MLLLFHHLYMWCSKVAMRKSVAAIVSSVDDAVGVVVESLKQAKMYPNSLVVLR